MAKPQLSRWRYLTYPMVAAAIIGFDQLIKFWIRANIHENTAYWDLGFFRLVYVKNTGAAFSLFAGYVNILIPIVFTVCALVVAWICFIPHRFPSLDRWLVRLALGAVLGGALGNQVDRLTLGSVTDYMDMRVWPVFNLADGSVVVGVIILVVVILFFNSSKNPANMAPPAGKE
jgi:signal peptidase II